MTNVPTKSLEVFYSYSPKDEALREKLESYLGTLKRRGLITDWHHREILPGTERRVRIDKHLRAASIILLLISPDFISSDYCYSNEMTCAFEQHNTGKARVIPIVLRPTDYEGTPVENLQMLPSNGKAVTEWRSRDKAFLDIVTGIRGVVKDILAAGEQDLALDNASQEYCHMVYERGKTLDFRGIHINQSQPISIPLLDIFIPPKVLIGIPEYETIPKAQIDNGMFPQELRDEYETVSQSQQSRASLWQELREPFRREKLYDNQDQKKTASRERHMVFHLEELYEVLPKHRRLVLLGDPGSGKSTLLRYMMLLLAQDRTRFFATFPSLADENLVLPLYIPLASYAEAWRYYAPGERSLKTFLDRHLCENYLDAYADTVVRQLARGSVLLLLDGLDEIPDASLRLQVVQQVEIFTQTYPANRFIITSRIVGYKDAPVSASSGYLAYGLAHFDEQQIRSFLQRWCPAYERWVNRAADQKYLEYLATKEAEIVLQSIHSRTAVRRLASNPLLLTILALLQRQGSDIPVHRVELYEFCSTTLLDTWGRTKGIATINTRFTRHELIKVLRPLAFWMHEHSAIGTVPEEDLIEQVVKQLLARKIARSEDEAAKLAEEFLHKVRGETGILVERGKNRYGFLHLTFEEYFAAGELEQREDRNDFIKTHLHDPRWREVILLTIGITGVLHHNEREATEMVRQVILATGSPYENWLHRDLLFAGICLADDVGIDMECEDEIIERVLSLTLTSPYDTFVETVSDVLTQWQSTRMAEKSLHMILPVLQQHDSSADPLDRIAQLSPRTPSHVLTCAVTEHYQSIMRISQESSRRLVQLQIMIPLYNHQTEKQRWINYALTSSHNPDWYVREKAAELFGKIEDDHPEVFQRLLDLLSDVMGSVRQAAAKALGERGHKEEIVITKLLSLLGESSWRSKQVAIETLGHLGSNGPRIREHLLRLLRDTSTDVRQAAIKVLWQLYSEQPEITEQLFLLLSDTNVKIKQTVVEIWGSWEQVPAKIVGRFFDLLNDGNPDVRRAASLALGYVGGKQPGIIARLVDLLSATEFKVREGAIRALGQTGQKQPLILERLFEFLSDPRWEMRAAAAEAFEYLGCEHPGVQEHLLILLSDPLSGVRQASIRALGQIPGEHSLIIEKLLDLLYDPFFSVKQAAIQVLGQWKDEKREINEELLGLLTDPDHIVVLEAIKAMNGDEEKYSQVADRLAEMLSHPIEHICYEAVSVAGQLTYTNLDIIERLLDLFYDNSMNVRQEVTKTLKQLGNRDEKVLHFLAKILAEASNPDVKLNTHILKILEKEKESLNQQITLRLLEIVKCVGKGHLFLTETLYKLMAASDSSVREEATKALGELNGDDWVIKEKLEQLLDDLDAGVRRAAIKSLGQLDNYPSEIVDKLLPLLLDNDQEVRIASFSVLNKINNNLFDKIYFILNAIRDAFPPRNVTSEGLQKYQRAVINFMLHLGLSNPELPSLLLGILSDSSADEHLQRVAANVLGYIGEGKSEVLIKELFNLFIASDASLWQRRHVITALGLLGRDHSDVIETFLNIIFAPDSSALRYEPLIEVITQSLRHFAYGRPKVVAKLFDILSCSDITSIQQATIDALAMSGNKEPETITRLLDLLSSSTSLLSMRSATITALGQLGYGQTEVTEKLLEFVSSSSSSERDAALIALVKQSREPMKMMDILLKSLTNPISKITWTIALPYILTSPHVDRLVLSQRVEQLLWDYEPTTRRSGAAMGQAERLFSTLQQIVTGAT